MNTSRHTSPLCIYELALLIIIAMNPYRLTIKELQLLRLRVVYLSEVCRKRAMREEAICLEMMMRDRHAQRLILVPSSKFVGYGSVDADDESIVQSHHLSSPVVEVDIYVSYMHYLDSLYHLILNHFNNKAFIDVYLSPSKITPTFLSSS